MQNAIHLELADKRYVFFADGVGHKNKTLVIDLRSNVIADPIFIVKMKHGGIDGFDQGGTVSSHSFEEMAEDRGILFFTIFLTITLD